MHSDHFRRPHYPKSSKGKYEFVISQNQFSDITNSPLFSDVTKSN